VVAGVFTSNQVKAAPILVSQALIRSGQCQAIIANSGNANCKTGKRGLADAYRMAFETARALKIKPENILVTSTGSIGHFLPMNKILKGIKILPRKLSRAGGAQLAETILTTDARKKEIAVEVDGYRIGGCAKGSGMIHPNLATMHAFITTDAVIDRATLQKMLKSAVANSFNMITVDQCQSTNDCVFVLANGLSGRRLTAEALEYVCTYLAKEIARDGEGATQLIEVQVTGARNEKEARIAARAIAGSDLLKCAVYGKDYNLGRIFAAVGGSRARIDPDKMKADMKFGRGETRITCDLGMGRTSATAWGCDLTEGYIRINARYHT
jgi:glutamate N-acetyltransferase/amino-acid N-acetyltransferase